MAKLKGVNVTGTIVPYGDSTTPDPYPVIDPVWGIGGWREVADVTARDAITAGRLRQGMIVYCVDGGSGSPAMFQYNGATWDAFAGGDGTVTSVTIAASDGVTVAGTIPITSSGTVTVGLGDITPTSVTATGTVTGSNLSGTNTGDQTITLTGDVTGSGVGTFATTIANGAISTVMLPDGTVTFPKIANLDAHTLLGNPTGSAAAPEEITLGAGLTFSGSTLVAAGAGGTVTSITAGSGLSGGTITTSGTIALSTIGNNSVLANITGGSAVPTSIAVTALVDATFGSAQGSVLYRGSSSWKALAPGIDGAVLTTHGPAANPSWTGGSGTVTSITAGAGLSGGTITTSGTIALAAIANHTVLANTVGASAVPQATTVTALLDDAIGSTQGDILYRSASGWQALAPGASDQVLVTGGTSANPAWADSSITVDEDGALIGTRHGLNFIAGEGISLAAVDDPALNSVDITIATTGSLASIGSLNLLANTTGGAAAPAGVSISDYLDVALGSTQGDVIYRSASAWSVLTPGTAGQVLTTQGPLANPDWTSAGLVVIANNRVLANVSGSSALPAANTLTAVIDSCIAATQGDVLYRSATAWSALAPGTSGQLLTSGGAAANPSWTTVTPGTGTVTQVTIASTPSWLTGTVATDTTTPAITLVGTPAQTANLFLATPSGSTGPVGLRAIVAADLPTVTAAQGGTGLVTLTAHAVLLGEGTGNVAFATIGTAGRLLLDQGAGADPSFNAMSGDATITSGGVVTVSKIGGTAISLPLAIANGGTGSTVGAASSHSFGVSGLPTLNAVTPPIFLARAVTCDGLTVGCGTAPSGGSVTVTVQTSTDGTTWTDLTSGAVSATTGTYLGTAACTTAITANTLVRGKFTAVNAAADIVCCLFVRS